MRGPVLIALLAGCGDSGQLTPDGEWQVTVTGVETDCTTSTEGYQDTFVYQLFFDGSNVELRIDGEGFATGTRSGCDLSYESSVWLEEAEGGDYRWQIGGEATYEGAAGGCDLPEGVDWQGQETLTVLVSDNPDVPEGCRYVMDTQGVYLGP